MVRFSKFTFIIKIYEEFVEFLDSICFAGKLSIQIVFHIFQCLVAHKKKQSMENYLQSMENPNKNKAYFLLDVFQYFFFWKTISLSHIISPINIIFFFTLYSLGNRTYFGAYSLTVSPTLPCTCNVSFLSSKTPFYSLLSVSLTIYIYIQ